MAGRSWSPGRCHEPDAGRGVCWWGAPCSSGICWCQQGERRFLACICVSIHLNERVVSPLCVSYISTSEWFLACVCHTSQRVWCMWLWGARLDVWRTLISIRDMEVSPDFTGSHGSWPVSVWLLDTTGGWCALTCGLGGQLLPWDLASSRITCCLLGTNHLSSSTV